MNVTLIITENQKKMLLSESLFEDFNNVIKSNFEFASEVINSSKEQMGINLKFLLTWGASIGGFVGPLNQFIQGVKPELTSVQVTSLLIGVIATHFLDNKNTILKIINKIKDDGLISEFNILYKKSKELKESFLNFIESLNITFHKMSNMMSYAFIIPLIEKLLVMAQNEELNTEDIKILSLRISSFGLLTMSSIAVTKLVNKIIKRFREN